jgi:hypothetical protein
VYIGNDFYTVWRAAQIDEGGALIFDGHQKQASLYTSYSNI